MASTWTLRRTEREAERFAKVLRMCPAEERGNLLLKVSKELKLESQHYTASIIEQAAKRYNAPVK